MELKRMELKNLEKFKKYFKEGKNKKMAGIVALTLAMSQMPVAVNANELNNKPAIEKEFDSDMMFASLSKYSFSDVTPNHWAYNHISKLAANGIVSGYEDGTYKPEKTVSRAEFTTLIVKTLDLKADESNNFYADLDAAKWAAGFINTAAKAGLVTDVKTNKFEPNAPMTREAAAVMFYNAMKYKRIEMKKDENHTFIDQKNISAEALEAVVAVVNNEIFRGYLDNSFKPEASITRAETSAVLTKFIENILQEELVNPTLQNTEIKNLEQSEYKEYTEEDVVSSYDLGREWETEIPGGTALYLPIDGKSRVLTFIWENSGSPIAIPLTGNEEWTDWEVYRDELFANGTIEQLVEAKLILEEKKPSENGDYFWYRHKYNKFSGENGLNQYTYYYNTLNPPTPVKSDEVIEQTKILKLIKE